jgi:magnesium-transporting ATPase (P-type)
VYATVGYERASSAGLTAKRQGSNARIIRQEDGKIVLENRLSSANVVATARKRSDILSIPSVLSMSSARIVQVVEPVTAESTVKKLGGAGAGGAYSEHLLELQDLAEMFGTKLDVSNVPASAGLTADQAGKLLEEFGPNVLTPPPRTPAWLLFLLQFTNLFMVLLLIVALLSFILYAIDPTQPVNLYLGILLFVVVFVTCYETFKSEYAADELMEKFRAMVPASASVVRGGQNVPIPAQDIVVGDLVATIQYMIQHSARLS